IMDPQAPLTMKETRAHPLGVGPMIAEGVRTGTTAFVQSSIEIIEQGLSIIWMDMYKRRDEEPPGDVTNVLWLLDRMRMVLRMPGYGFGRERVLYDLNPD